MTASLTPQQTDALALIAEGATDADVVAAGVVPSATTIRRWRAASGAWGIAEAELLAENADVLGVAGRRAILGLSDLSEDAVDEKVRLAALSKLADLHERREARVKTVGGGAAQASVIVVTAADIAAAREAYYATDHERTPPEPAREDGVLRALPPV